MKFTSNWSQGAVFWRTFSKNDTVYIIGLSQGTVLNGGTAEFNAPSGFFQMELKRGGLFGPTLVPAGHVYSDSDEYILLDDGEFKSVEDAAVVTIDPGFKFQPYGSVVQFFSAGAADSAIKITSALQQTVSTAGSNQTTVSQEASNENTTQVGGKQSANFGTDVKVGVELSESFSNKVTDKISQTIVNQMSVSISTQTTYSEEQTITLKANRLTAVQTSWQRRFLTGGVNLGSHHLTYDATVGYMGSRLISDYASPDKLPPELMAAYIQQNPAYHPPVNLNDGSVLREQSTAPVYVIFGGAKFQIPNPTVLAQLYGGWGNVVVVPDQSLDAVPTTPRDGTVLREADHAEVWLIEAGQRQHITSTDVLNRYGGWAVVRVVPDDATLNFPTGNPIT
jgi:hypothetical protein